MATVSFSSEDDRLSSFHELAHSRLQNHILAPENFVGTFKKTISQLTADTGMGGTYLWRIVRGERAEASREVLVLMSMTIVLDKAHADQVAEIANQLLDAGGHRMLRGRYESMSCIELVECS